MIETRGTIVRNESLGGGAFWMEIDAPNVAPFALPGQFAMVRCSEGIDPLTGRPFSIADVVKDRICFAYLVVGRGTGLMSRMKPGHLIPVHGPLGQPFGYDRPARRHVMIAGGIGCAPFPYLARAIADSDPKAERVLLFGGRTKEQLYRLDLFEDLCSVVETATDDGSSGHKGFVTDLLEPYLGQPDTRLYACGPTVMFQTINRLLEGHDTPCEISVEPIMACGFGACYGCVVPFRQGDSYTYVKSCEEGPTFEIRDLVVDLMEAH